MNRALTEPLPQVGAPDPERDNSPIVDESAYDEQAPLPDLEANAPSCRFNGEEFAHGAFVLSGAELLQCDRGVWVRRGERPDA